MTTWTGRAGMQARAAEHFSNILAYVPDIAGDDDPGLRRAIALARADGAALTLVDVADEPATPIGRALHPRARDPHERRAEKADRLEERVAALRRDGVTANADVLVGVDWIEVVRTVLRGRFDLVVKTARPGAEDRGMRMGALAVRLFRACPCPVWVEPQRAADGCKRVAATIAPGPEADALNRQVLEHAAAVAHCTGAELHFVHAWTVFGEELLHHHMRRSELTEHVHDIRDDARTRLRDALARAGARPPDDRIHCVKGDPEAAIPAYADQVGADVVVVGTFARTGIAGWVVGNTADRLLPRIGCSVVAVKPADFTSPVALN